MAAQKKSKKERRLEKKELKKSNTLKKVSDPITASKSNWLVAFVIAAFTFICFSSAINNDFVNWDDDRNFYDNEHITTLNDHNFWENTKKIFTSNVIGGYNPLTIFTFAIDNQIHGLDNPAMWHLENVILHLFCTLLVFFIMRRLGLSLIPAALAAMLFGIHPMRVESVAWVTERKDVLFGFFYLTALLYYIKHITVKKKTINLVIIWTCFILALLSKIQAVVLPISLVLVDYYFDGKLDFKKIIHKIPMFLTSILFGILGIMFLEGQGSLSTTSEHNGFIRIFIGSYQYTVYLIKSIVPYRLSPLYPYPAEIPWYFYASILSFIATVPIMFYAYKKQFRALFFGLGFFIANVFFLLQILGAGQGFLADRFTYIAYIGLFFLFAIGLQHLSKKYEKLSKGIWALSFMILVGYGFMTYNQNKIWKNSGTLWTHVLKYYQNSTLPYGNRANYYRDEGKSDLALADYNKRLALKQDDAEVFNSRGRLYFNFPDKASLQKALSDYNQAIAIDDTEAEYFANRGATYARLENPEAAIADLDKAIALNPNFANSYLNRSVIRNQLQRYQGALEDITIYLKFKPFVADIWYEKSRLENILKLPNEAIASSANAIKYNPNKGLYYIERAKAFYLANNKQEAINNLNKATSLGQEVNPKVLELVYAME